MLGMSLAPDDIEDIKQLMAANNRALLAEFEKTLDRKLDQKLEQKLEQKLQPIRNDIKELADFVRNTIDTTNEVTGEQIDDHERRITKLEQVTI